LQNFGNEIFSRSNCGTEKCDVADKNSGAALDDFGADDRNFCGNFFGSGGLFFKSNNFKIFVKWQNRTHRSAGIGT